MARESAGRLCCAEHRLCQRGAAEGWSPSRCQPGKPGPPQRPAGLSRNVGPPPSCAAPCHGSTWCDAGQPLTAKARTRVLAGPPASSQPRASAASQAHLLGRRPLSFPEDIQATCGLGVPAQEPEIRSGSVHVLQARHLPRDFLRGNTTALSLWKPLEHGVLSSRELRQVPVLGGSHLAPAVTLKVNSESLLSLGFCPDPPEAREPASGGTAGAATASCPILPDHELG